MEIPINYLAVLIAAISNMVLGFIWYGPLFGKTWIRLIGLTEEKLEAQKKKGMGKAYGIQALGSLVMSYVLAHTLIFASSYTNTTGIPAGLMAGFWSWLGFIAPVSLASVLWEGKPWKFWLITTGYYLVALLLMGSILASF